MGSGELQLGVVAGFHLRCVGLHGGAPRGDHFRRRHVNEHRLAVPEGSAFGSDGVEEQLADGVSGLVLEFGESAVTGEAGGIADELRETPVVGMLVLLKRRREDDGAGLVRRMMSGELDGMRGANLQMRIAIELDEFHRCAQKRGGVFGFGGAFGRCAIGPALAAGTHDEVNGTAGASFAGDDSPAAEFDIVRMSAKGQQQGLIGIHAKR